MNLELNQQQKMLHDAALRFFDNADSVARARTAGESVDIALWAEAVEMGFPAMRLPDAKGGINAGLLDAALVCEAAGRGIAPIPLPDAVAGARLLSLLDGEAASALLQRLGTTPLSFLPVNGATCITLEGDEIFALSDGKRERLAAGPDAAALYEAAMVERAALRAAWQVGAGTRAVELAAAYATERKQFGVAIGTFQGLAFPLADAITALEGGRLLVWRAIFAVAKHDRDAAALVAMADWWTAATARDSVRQALRTFGGYGLSVEYDIHLFFLAIERAALGDGDPEARLALAGERLWLGRATCLPDAGEPGVEMGFSPAEESFAAEVRRFFDAEMTPELAARALESTDGYLPDLHQKLAAAGFAYPDWPTQWGGQERSPMEMTALGRVFEEYRSSRIPIGCTNMGARMVMAFGSPELKAEVLPRMADGSAFSCLGFTESASGSDMYAASVRASPDGDDWIISGQKMFTTGAHFSDYVLMLARTDVSLPKHAGITIFFVPMNLPGVAIQPVETLQDERTNITFYDDVRVPDRYRLGAVNGGLSVMAAAMEIEHGGEGYHIYHHSLMESALGWAHEVTPAGQRPIDDGSVRLRLAKARTHLEVADLLCRRVAWAIGADRMTRTTGPMAKLFATESYMIDAADLSALTAPGSLRRTTPGLAEIEEAYRRSISQTIYGGTSEIHRSIIAQHALGLPR